MRRLFVVLFALFAAPSWAQSPSPGDLVINEVMYDPPSSQGSTNEWIELYNRSSQTFDLIDLRLADAADTTDVTDVSTPLAPDGYAVLVRDGAAFAIAYPGVAFVEVEGFPTLNNTGDTPRILVGTLTIDVVPYQPSWGGVDASLERINPGGPSDDPDNFATTLDPDGGTPGEQNSVFSVDETPPSLAEVLATDALTVEVFFDEPVEEASAEMTSNYTISAGIGTPVEAVLAPDGDPTHVTLTLGTPLSGPQSYTLTASGIADLAGNVLSQDTAEFFFAEGDDAEPRDIVINEIMFDPPASQGTGNEWIELFNRTTDKTFNLGQFRFADSADTTALPANAGALAPGDYAVLVADGDAFALAYPGVSFVEVPGFPTLNNSGDVPRLLFDGTSIDAVPYQPSWGGTDASLERIDPNGPSDFPSNFATTLDPDGGTPGAQNSVFAPDIEPPSLLRASAVDPSLIDVFFSEPVDPISAGDPTNYGIDSGIGTPLLAEVAPEGDPSQVRLVVGTPLEPNTSYTLTVMDIADFVGNVLVQDQTTFFFGQGAVPQPRDLVVNEFLYDEPSSGSSGEWVELFNRTDEVFDLADFTLGDSAGEAPISESSVFVLPGSYTVLVENASAFSAVFPDVPFVVVPGWRSLNNSGDAIVLCAGAVLVDSLFYDDSWGGEDASLERRDPDGPSSFAVNWQTTLDPDGGTPGEQNSVFEPDTSPPQAVLAQVSLDGRTVTVVFDEPLEEASVTATSFAITGPVSPGIKSATYALTPDPTVVLTLAQPLVLGDYLLTVNGVRDLLGNAAQDGTLAFSFEPDVTPPALVVAFVLDATTVEVQFSEPVTVATASDPGRYSIDGGIGAPESVTFPVDGDDTVARLVLATPLNERQLYTLTVDGIADASGNLLPASTASLFFGEADTPAPGDLIVNEIHYDPLSGSDGEYVELLNRTDKLFDLRRFTLSDDADPDAPTVAETPLLILPGAFAVLVADRDTFRVRFPDVEALVVEARGFPSLNNSGDLVRLAFGGTAIDSVVYDPDWHRIELEDATGIALERIAPDGPSNAASNWTSSLDPSGGTPGLANSVFVAEGQPPGSPGLDIDSPFDPDGGQSSAIRYTLATDAALVRVRIFDGAGRLVRQLEDGALTGPTGTLLWDGRDDNGRRLRIGIYVVLLEAVNVEGVTSEAHRGVAVLAR